MTCWTFIHPVINLIWNKQYVFFILVAAIWWTPLRDQVWQEVNKQYHGLTTLKSNCYYDITFWKNGGVRKYDEEWRATGTRICVFTVSASTTDRKIAEPESRMDSPVRIIKEENTGRNGTRMKMILEDKDQLHQYQHSKVTSHLC
jgi:hypothetical protein